MRKIIVDGVGRPTFDFRTGLDDSRGVRLLALQLLQFSSCFGRLFLGLSLARSGFFGFPLGLLFGASRLGRLRLSLGLARRRLLGQACVEINQ